MIDIEMQSFRGILFVRLSGKLTRQSINTLNKEVIKLVKKVGIKNIVFNLQGINEIDKYGENILFKSMNLCLSNKGQMLICASNSQVTDKISEKIKIVNDELTAVHLINS